MNAHTKIGPSHVIGPLGEPLTLDSLPPQGTIRWVVRRKAEVLAAIAGGLLSIEEACQRYELSVEELMLWRRAVERSGIPGLRVKMIQRQKPVVPQEDNTGLFWQDTPEPAEPIIQTQMATA